MKTVNIQISDLEFDRLGLKKSNLSFSEFIEIIEKHIIKLTLEKSILLSEKYGIANMTMNQINDEIKSLRDAKTDS
jgi:hypothetical protein